MSEMLANQYFLARKFDKAIQHLESIISDEPKNERESGHHQRIQG